VSAALVSAGYEHAIQRCAAIVTLLPRLETASCCADDPLKLFLPSKQLFSPTVAMQSPNQLNRLEKPMAAIPRSVAFHRR
jgi:hypothetical protein